MLCSEPLSFWTFSRRPEFRKHQEQNRKCAFNLTFRRVRLTFIALEKQYVLNMSVFVIRHAKLIILSAQHYIFTCNLSAVTIFFHVN